MNRIVLLCIVLLYSVFSFGQGYDVTLKVDNYKSDTVVIGYQFGDKQYVKDTVFRKDGLFKFKGDTEIEGGVYLVILKQNGKTDYFQILMDEGDQKFTIKTDYTNLLENLTVKNSPNNETFFAYMKFLGNQRVKADKLKQDLEAAQTDKEKETIQAKQDEIDKQVFDYQKNIIEKHEGKLVSAMLKGSSEIEAPTFEGENAEENRYRYYKKHWFDNIDLNDDRLIRTPILFGKVNQYMEKMVIPAPDSVNAEIDYLLGSMNKEGDNFRFFLVHFLNTYAASKYVGMDAVYVHIVKTYYETGLATWTEPDQLAKIIENANILEPILIGKTAPDIKAQIINVEETIKRKDNPDEHKRFVSAGVKNLHDVQKKYTVLFIWDPDCGHCKKSMPDIIDFYEKYNDKVEVYAICNKTYKDLPECAQYIKDKIPVNWINIMDPYLQSRYKQNYDVKSTPQIFVLDAEKKIISKKLGTEQLAEVIDRFEKLEEEKLKKQ